MTWSGTSCAGAASTFTHEAALQQATAQALSIGVAWRLPSVKELSSIADKSLQNPTIDVIAFPATPAGAFWSASPYVGSPAYAWLVYFYDGNVNAGGRDFSGYVRLVLASQ